MCVFVWAFWKKKKEYSLCAPPVLRCNSIHAECVCMCVGVYLRVAMVRVIFPCAGFLDDNDVMTHYVRRRCVGRSSYSLWCSPSFLSRASIACRPGVHVSLAERTGYVCAAACVCPGIINKDIMRGAGARLANAEHSDCRGTPVAIRLLGFKLCSFCCSLMRPPFSFSFFCCCFLFLL